jgi:hypothetical protein
MLGIRRHREHHEVAEFECRRPPQSIEECIRRAHHAEINVFRGSRAIDTEFDDETAFEHGGVAKLADDAREETVEDEELAPPCEVRSARGSCAKPILHCLFEGCRGGVTVHAAFRRARIVLS